MISANSPFQRINGRQQNQVGAAITGQYSSPAGTVTPPVTQQGGGAGFQQMQAPGVNLNGAPGNGLNGVVSGVKNIGGLLGMMNGNGQLTAGQNQVLGAAGLGGAIGSMFGAPAIGAGLGAIGSLF